MMNRAAPKAVKLAEHLLRLETVAGKRAAGSGTAASRASEKLRRLLSAFLGSAGFRALLARALTLTKAEVPGMSAVQVKADGSLEGRSEVEPQSHSGESANGEVILLAYVLGLLVVFVGEAIVLRLLQDAWPKATLDHLDFAEGESP